jgi:hypothetical protein
VEGWTEAGHVNYRGPGEVHMVHQQRDHEAKVCCPCKYRYDKLLRRVIRLEILMSSLADDSPVAEKARLLALDGRGAILVWLDYQPRSRQFQAADIYRDLEGYVSMANIRMILSRFTNQGQIERIRDGVYKPT